MSTPKVKKVALAYSGGLDTSIIIPWLKENYGCEVVAVAVDVGQAEETAGLEGEGARDRRLRLPPRSTRARSSRRSTSGRVLRAGAVYEHEYLLGTVDGAADHRQEAGRDRPGDRVRRPLPRLHREGERPGPLRARLPGARARARRSSRRGASGRSRSREEAIDYAAARNIPVPVTKKEPYSRDRNLWHISHEGGPLEDPAFEPEESMFKLTVDPREGARRARARDDRLRGGLPGRGRTGSCSPRPRSSTTLNEIAARHGVGRVDIVENRLVGIKSRGVYETPGGTLLVQALRALETLTLDRDAMHEKERLALRYAELVYYGQWFSPLREALEAFVEKVTETVHGRRHAQALQGLGDRRRAHVASTRSTRRTSPRST